MINNIDKVPSIIKTERQEIHFISPKNVKEATQLYYKITEEIATKISSNNKKYGVYVDFFDSVGIDIDVPKSLTGKLFLCAVDAEPVGMFKTRQEAREQAIIKANEIYNND